MSVLCRNGFLRLHQTKDDNPMIFIKGSAIQLIEINPVNMGTVITTDFRTKYFCNETLDEVLEGITMSYQQARFGR